MKLGVRRRVVLGAVGSFAIGLAILFVAFNYELDRRLDSDVRGILDSRGAAQRANLAAVNGRLRVRETRGDAALDGAAWVLQGHRLVDPPHIPAQIRRVVDEVGPGPDPTQATAGDAALLIRTVAVGRAVPATIVSAVPLGPYHDTQRLALVASAVVAMALLGLVAVIANRTVSAALRPVHWMTEQAETWSERDLHRRFDLGTPHDELTELAATLDGLLERVDASFRHEQRFSAEVAHELRTPLARQRAEIELALRHGNHDPETRKALGVLLREVDRMTVTVDTLVAAAQAELDPSRDVSSSADVLTRLAEALGDSGEHRQARLAVVNSRGPVKVDVELDYAVQTLLPVVENALRYASESATIACALRGHEAVFTITDDGPGVSADELEAIFEPGTRGDASGPERGAGLGLPLARRLARAVGGEVVAVADARGGAFEVRLPARAGPVAA